MLVSEGGVIFPAAAASAPEVLVRDLQRDRESSRDDELDTKTANFHHKRLRILRVQLCSRVAYRCR